MISLFLGSSTVFRIDADDTCSSVTAADHVPLISGRSETTFGDVEYFYALTLLNFNFPFASDLRQECPSQLRPRDRQQNQHD